MGLARVVVPPHRRVPAWASTTPAVRSTCAGCGTHTCYSVHVRPHARSGWLAAAAPSSPTEYRSPYTEYIRSTP